MDNINIIHDIMSSVMALATIAITIMSFLICMPRKTNVFVIIISFIVFTAGILLLNTVTGHINNLPVPNGWPFIPLVILFFKGHIFEKLFLLFANFFISFSIIIFFSMAFGFFVQYGSMQIFLMMIAAVFFAFTAYIIFVLKFGKRVLEKIFGSGSKKEWALYMISIFILYYSQFFLQRIHVQNNLFYFIAQIFLIWSFIILCYAIINTNEKTKQKYEADFARGIIATGRGHYKKMNELYDALKVMRHDYKFHLNAALEMLQRGETEKGSEYLSGLQNLLKDNDLHNFSDNPVINSLVADYAGKCDELKIDFNVSIKIPPDFSLSNYEMCIVLGNLLENAVEACLKLKPPSENERQIKLAIKPQGEQLAIMVRNTFDGNVVKDGEKYISTKENESGTGIGLHSVMAVAGSYGEMFHIEHDSKWFNVFFVWKQGE
ncbi:MAG: ATP-binding protein [Treponema sp.]|nr:ATP-binding protein [Treponema sp.]